MRKGISISALLVFCVIMFCGCSQSRQVENQAYVIALGVDAAEGGGIMLTAKIPVLSGSSGEQASAGDSYKHFSATGSSYNSALKNLHAASPRNLNLSQLELLTISRTLAETHDFRTLIEDIAQTERLFTASNTVICSERATDFITALEPAVGSRLSLDLPAIFENYMDQGLIPKSNLADLYYLTETFYSDPMVARAALTKNDSPGKLSEGIIVPYSKTSILGSAAFADGQMLLELDADETLLANLIRNGVKYFRYEIDGMSIEAAPYAPTRISVDLSKNPILLTVKLRLNIGTQEDMPTESSIKETITADMQNLIRKAQRQGVDPFGFADKAASGFSTIAKWQAFDWRSAYQSAEIDISVSLTRWDA